MPTSLLGLANKARDRKQYVFRNLYVLINEEYLHDCWRLIRKDAAYGVDKISAQEYEQNLDENIHNLVEVLKRNFYHAKLVRRQYIPKPDGRKTRTSNTKLRKTRSGSLGLRKIFVDINVLIRYSRTRSNVLISLKSRLLRFSSGRAREAPEISRKRE